MLYIYVEKNQIKLLYLKKSLLNQFETHSYTKRHEVGLLEKGKVLSMDILASALKDAITQAQATTEKEVYLILPQESFEFLRTEVPADIATAAISSFAFDKARADLEIDMNSAYWSYFVKEVEAKKLISLYAISNETVDTFAQTLQLLGLKLTSILPDTLAVFKLFEKTLRKEKKENILYVSFIKDVIEGYLFDSGALLKADVWRRTLAEGESIESVVKTKVEDYEKDGVKLNRIILSGEGSDHVRQDTFTKEVGVWTNPLKRIVPNFYDEYLKMLVVSNSEHGFPILTLDTCFGAFVFSQEDKEFQILKKPIKSKSGGSTFSLSKFPLFRKEFFFFLLAAAITFSIVYAGWKMDLLGGKLTVPNFMAQATPTPTLAPAPTTTPMPKVNVSKLNVKVLNGSGTAGKATAVKKLFVDAGFKEVLTGNADNFDYTKTVIQIKDSAKGATDTVKKILLDGTKSVKVESLSDKEASDIVVIFGSDFE